MALLQPKAPLVRAVRLVILGVPSTFGDFCVQFGFELDLVGVLCKDFVVRAQGYRRLSPPRIRSGSYLLLSAVLFMRACNPLGICNGWAEGTSIFLYGMYCLRLQRFSVFLVFQYISG